MTKPPSYDFGALEKKLSRGKSIELAAEESGVPLEHALTYLRGRSDTREFDDETLRLAAAEALHHGLDALIEASKIRNGRIGSVGDGDHGGVTKFDHPDVDAGKALVSFALACRKLLRPVPKEASGGGSDDLFDKAEHSSPWQFKKADG